MTPELKELSNLDLMPYCFSIGFNGPIDPRFAHIAHANSSDPLTLLKRLPSGLTSTKGRRQFKNN